jgi:isocitrate lyase
MEDVKRPYSKEDVERLKGSVKIEHTLATRGAKQLRKMLKEDNYVNALGAVTGNQAIQQVKAGLKAIYCSGWQVAADGNLDGTMYPDQSLYSARSVPLLVKKINNALQRADQIDVSEGNNSKEWFAPIVADAEAGFGGPLNAFELMKSMIEAGASGVHFEDQLSSAKKCGHMGGKVLIPTGQFIKTLTAARLAADVSDVPTVLIARTDADAAKLLTSDIDERDRPFIAKKERTGEGFFHIKSGLESAIARAKAYAPYADMIWCETSTPDLAAAKKFAEEVKKDFPNQMLAYNCSPSFNWRGNLSEKDIVRFQKELGQMGYKFQFVTLAGFHTLNNSMFELAGEYRETGMQAYADLQDREFKNADLGYTAVKHQREVGAGYFDAVSKVIGGDDVSTLALKDSTEEGQF